MNTRSRYGKALSAQEVEKFVVRLPVGMRSRIAEVAGHSRRSMNSEIVARLEQSLAGNEPAQGNRQAADRGCPPVSAVPNPGQPTAEETLLVERFRRLPAHRREALLRLLGED